MSVSATPKCEGIHVDLNSTGVDTVSIEITDASFSTTVATGGNDYCDFDIVVHSRVPIKLTLLVQDSQLSGKIDVRAPLKVDSSIQIINSRIKGLYVASNYIPVVLTSSTIWRDGVTILSTYFSSESITSSGSSSSSFNFPSSSPLFPSSEPKWNSGSGVPTTLPQFSYSGNPSSYSEIAPKRISLKCKNSVIDVDTTKIDNSLKTDVLTIIGNTSTILWEGCSVGTGGVVDNTK